MARTSKKRIMTEQQQTEEVKKTFLPADSFRIFQAALYVRLSVEDGGKDNSSAVENQLALLKDYVSDKPNIKVYSAYVDNGSTGTNFERPQFIRMLEDMKRGKIDCIIVKDLSRFGRNYLETGNYIEKIFPFFQVRFIAVTDHFDTENADKTEEGLMVPLKNLINDIYAKDISRKVSSALETKKGKGEHGGGVAPYGYVKSKDEKGKLVVDVQTAPIVKRIFEMRAEGYGYHAIARALNEEAIPSPSAYRYQNGMVSSDKYRDVLWKRHVITDMLKNQIYLGNMVRGKSKSAIYRGEYRHPVEEKEWSILQNRHEAIVSHALFDAVKQVTEERKSKHMKELGKYDYLGTEENYLKGKVFCADCGCRLTLYKSVLRRKDVYYSYICANYEENKERICCKKSIPKKELEQAVLEAVRLHMRLFSEERELIRQWNKSLPARDKREELEMQIKKVQGKIAKTENMESNLYVDYKDSLLTETEYLFIKEKYRSDLENFQQRCGELRKEKSKYEETYGEEMELNHCILTYESEAALTGEMADSFIEAIKVYEDKRVEIQFRYQDEFDDLCVAQSRQTLERVRLFI